MGSQYIPVLCGSDEILELDAKRMKKLSDIELMDEYVQKCNQSVDPFLFQEMVSRRLIFKGDTYRDVAEQLYRLKSGM